MKTTLEIHDELLRRAKRHAQENGCTLRSVVEDGLRSVLSESDEVKSYVLEDLSVGDPAAANPLERYSWPELREVIYGGSAAR